MDQRTSSGFLAIALMSVLSIVVSIAVGIFFGAGFGFLSYALFVCVALVCVLKIFKDASDGSGR